MVERIVECFGIEREGDSTVTVPAPEPRPGLEAEFAPSEIAVHANLASDEQAARLAAVRRDTAAARDHGTGPAPLVRLDAPGRPRRHLSYTAIAADAADAQGGLAGAERSSADDADAQRTGGLVRGRAVHALLEWSRANAWQVPPADVVRRVAGSAEVGADEDLDEDAILNPLRAWLDSPFFDERIRNAASARAEIPLLVEIAGTVLRGSIDLLVEEPGRPPLIVDYKTDRVDGAPVLELAARYEIQQSIYALAVAEARQAQTVELAYIFLERPDEPFIATWDATRIDSGRQVLTAEINRLADAP